MTNQDDGEPAFTTKPNISHYPEYTDPTQYTTWIASTAACLRAHGCAELLNPGYTPANNPKSRRNRRSKLAFGYMMLDQKIKTNTGRQIVQIHRFTGDAQAVFRELEQEAFTSTAATLGNEELFAKIITIRYDGRSKSAVDFVVGLDQMFDQYNEQQLNPSMRVNDMMMKTFMRSAVAEVTMLLDVNNQ